MAVLTVRNIPEAEMAALRVRAAEHGRSMEAEVRDVIVALAQGARLIHVSARPPIAVRVAKAQAMIRARLGDLPTGRVDALLAERRAEAEREE